MAIIYSYPRLTSLSADDLLLVTDSSGDGKPTRNITVQQIVDLIPGIVPGAGTVSSVELDLQTTGLTTSGNTSQTITGAGSFNIAGTLAQSFGGTGFNTYGAGTIIYANASGTLVQLPIGAGDQVLKVDSGTTLPVWGSAGGNGTVTSVQVAGGTTGLSFSGGPITSSGTITMAGTLAISNGGTGATTQSTALDAITNASSGTTGQVLTTDGANASWSTISSGVSSWSGGTTGLVSSGGDPATGAVVLAVGSKLISNNGGTGYSNTDLQEGDILYKGPSVLSRLPMLIGDANKVLTVNSAGTAPEWKVVPGGVGGSGTNGKGARWTSSTNLADSAFFDEGTNVGLGVSPVANQHFTIDSSLYSTSIKILNKNSAVGHIGINAAVGEFYAGAQDIIGLQGTTIGSSSGKRQGGLFTSTTNTSGINIGITASALNGGTGSHYAARFQDGQQSIGRYWKCVTADGDGQWATINDANTTYDLGVKAQGGDAFGTLSLSGSDGTTDSVKYIANNSAQVNSDLVVYGDDAAGSLAYAHKDIFSDAGGNPGQYIGVTSLNVSTSGHITAVVSEKFTGTRPEGIKMEQASFAGENADEVLALPMISTGSGKFGDVGLQVITGGQAGAQIQIAYYNGLLGAGIGVNNILICSGSINVANIGGNQSIACPIPDSSFTQPSPNDNFIEGENYIMVIRIPQGCKLQSASQDGDLINGGCKLSNYTPTPATLSGITTVARVAGTPLLMPATQFIGA
jgi:hypothetical protein